MVTGNDDLLPPSQPISLTLPQTVSNVFLIFDDEHQLLNSSGMSIAVPYGTELKKIMQGNIHSTSRAVLVTGASRGIGLELAKLFARDGFDLVLVARKESDLSKVADELQRIDGVSVTVIPKDLSLPAAAEELYQELQRKNIEVDVLVNNAGFGLHGPFSSTDLRKELQMLQLNIVTLTQLVKKFLPGMLERRSGKILNVSSTAAFTPGPNVAVYFASKAYVQSFSEALAEELRGTGVSITALCPGPTSTDFAERAGLAETRLFGGHLATAKEVAAIGYSALMHEQRSVVVGAANKLLIFSLRFSPRNLVAKVTKGLLSRVVRSPQPRVKTAH